MRNRIKLVLTIIALLVLNKYVGEVLIELNLVTPIILSTMLYMWWDVSTKLHDIKKGLVVMHKNSTANQKDLYKELKHIKRSLSKIDTKRD